jgi:4-hydroxy-tetrahydrodipicolinate synthase/2-dehydro-3-deoxy-D-gluconate aldolase
MRVINSANFPSGYYYAFYRKFGLNGGYRAPMMEPFESVKAAINGLNL